MTINRKIPPISPLSPLESNTSTNNRGNSGDTPLDGGDITSTIDKISPSKQPENERHIEKSGDIIFCM
jgi:hypothetical protein